MNIAQVEEKVKALVSNPDQTEFLFNLLECYGKPKASITRLKMVGKGGYNLSKKPNEVLWKKQVYFKATDSDELLSVIDEMKHAEVVTKHQPRFIIALNDTHLLAIDTKIDDTLDIPLAELNKKFDFFLPWAGLEKAQARGEDPADVNAAEKMAKLFDLLRENNPASTAQEIHTQNVFLSRILFCYFAEDTGIFKPNLFTNHVASHTAVEGTDLSDYLSRVFDVMNQEHRKDLPDYLTDFPYVNGGLFADKLPVPKFNRKSRAMLIECGSDLNWSEINPDIFGSMIQAVVDPNQRGNMGMHYTSVPNIMKVIDPLFLNELKEEFEKHSDTKSKLEQLLLRLEHLKIFDPACGSGNFLIIAYKELRQLEMMIFKRLQELSNEGIFPLSRIKLSQFYGIELDDFAHEVAILSLWLAEHQMNMKFKTTFGQCNPALPLKSGGNIYCGNAARINWLDVCPKADEYETYILGNPPYLGSRLQSKVQKEDMKLAFYGVDTFQDLDYVACWFIKAARYVGKKDRFSFVATSSLCQGSQVYTLWPVIFDFDLEIFFAHKSFKWANNAKNKAGVTCSIIGLRAKSKRPCFIYIDSIKKEVANINAYLSVGNNIIVTRETLPISKIPRMTAGNYTGHAQGLTLSDDEANELVLTHPESKRFLRKLVGSNEFIKGISRWCLWISDADRFLAEGIPAVKKRIELVKKSRLESIDKEANKLASRPHQFRDLNETKTQSIIVPIV
jgi:hypothetical protein